MNLKRVLVVAAHPDDDILGCGGTIAKYAAQGVEFRVVFIAEGTSCRYHADDIETDPVREEIERRNGYAIKALEVLNVRSFKFCNLPCGRLDMIPIIDIGKIVESEIKSFNPDTIFVHNHSDVNNDHARVFQATLQATRPGAQNLVDRVYAFEVLSSTEWRFVESFRPNVFVALEHSHVEAKIAAINEYVSEIKPYPFPRSAEGLEAKAKTRGMQVGCAFAEAFELVREISR